MDNEEAATAKVRGLVASPAACSRLSAALRLMEQHVVSLTLPQFSHVGDVSPLEEAQQAEAHVAIYKNNVLHVMERALRTANTAFRLASNDTLWERATCEPQVRYDSDENSAEALARNEGWRAPTPHTL